MTLISELRDRSACAAWSPVPSQPDLIALGTKDSGSAGFDDAGGELDLYQFPLSGGIGGGGGQPQLLASHKTDVRFASIAWTPSTNETKYPLGWIAAGMVDGHVLLFDPVVLVQEEKGSSALLAKIKPTDQSGPIQALEFNSLQKDQLAVGTASGQVVVLDFETSVGQPKVHILGGDGGPEITSIAWNSQVSHIVASGSTDGSVCVWDIKGEGRLWAQVRASIFSIAAIAWHPHQGLHLLTAASSGSSSALGGGVAAANSGAPAVDPTLMQLWDLAASTTMPVAQLPGHAQGILSLSWCPHDDTLLLTTAKDNRTYLWDLLTLQPIAMVPHPDAEAAAAEAAAMAASSSSNKGSAAPTPSSVFAQAVAPAAASSNSLTSLGGQQKHMRYQVAWSPCKRGVALLCSLDRKVAVHSLMSLCTQTGRPPAYLQRPNSVATAFGGAVLTVMNHKDENGAIRPYVTLSRVVEQEALARTSESHEADWQTLLMTDRKNEFCQRRQRLAKSATDKTIWGFMEVIFDANARQALLEHLGFRQEEITAAASRLTGESDAMTNGGVTGTASMPEKVQEAVKDALIVGNFETAVNLCAQAHHWADALILASCGGAELWSQTQQRFFSEETKSRPYLSIVSMVITNQMPELVAQSDPQKWKETLAILSTYGPSDEFPSLCIGLGDRLDDSGDSASASICYMCALNLEKTMQFWKAQYEGASTRKRSITDLLALHDFVVKVSVFMEAAGQTAELPSETADLFTRYAQALAEQGLLSTAAKYCRGSSEPTKELRDRLYRSRATQGCLAAMGSPPDFPYQMVPVDTSRGQYLARDQRDREKQLQQQEQEAQYNGQQAGTIDQSANATAQQWGAQETSYGEQQAYAQQHTQGYAQADSGTIDALPPGWIELQDPTSGYTYYANQATGETTWDRPLAVSTAPSMIPQPMASTSVSATDAINEMSTHSTRSKQSLASKYGDGFVTSASDPTLADQYGNVGTSNPYTGAERPGTAAAAAGRTNEKPPVSGTLNIESLSLTSDLATIRDSLLAVIETLNSSQLITTERRQLSEAEKAVAILVKKLARGDMEDGTKSNISTLVMALVNRDFGSATAMQTALVNSDWRDQKDWLKGIKLLIQLAAKKLAYTPAPGY